MRDLTEEEIRDYLDFAHRNPKPDAFTPEQAQLIAKAVDETGLMDTCARKIGKFLLEGTSPQVAFRTLWLMGFQMGRECESRLLTRALQKGAKV